MVNQVTAKKMMEMIREIKNVAKKKLPRTKWMRGGVGGLALISSLSAQPSADPLPKLGIPGPKSVGSLEWLVGSAGDTTPSWVSTLTVRAESRYLTINGISCLPLPGAIPEVEILEGKS